MANNVNYSVSVSIGDNKGEKSNNLGKGIVRRNSIGSGGEEDEGVIFIVFN